jgi:hypothetical protein
MMASDVCRIVRNTFRIYLHSISIVSLIEGLQSWRVLAADLRVTILRLVMFIDQEELAT